MNLARTGARAALASAAGALFLFTAAPLAAAQDTTYGSTTTTTADVPDVPGGSADTGCSLSIDEGKPGAVVEATVFPVEPGAVVRILFDGEQVGIGTAPTSTALATTDTSDRGAASIDFGVTAQATGSAVRFGQAAPVTSVTISFRVPDVSVGAHSVTAVGANFTCFCNPDGIFNVLAKDAGRTGALARTGIYVGLFLVVAAFCFVLGRAFLRASHIARARAEAASREAERPRITLDA
ncbi:MAG: hypothetical protein M3Z03_01870 [Actinomycetota bacterium]|nr:hypothetical protein [Actinomycetota bacterium]